MDFIYFVKKLGSQRVACFKNASLKQCDIIHKQILLINFNKQLSECAMDLFNTF